MNYHLPWKFNKPWVYISLIVRSQFNIAFTPKFLPQIMCFRSTYDFPSYLLELYYDTKTRKEIIFSVIDFRMKVTDTLYILKKKVSLTSINHDRNWNNEKNGTLAERCLKYMHWFSLILVQTDTGKIKHNLIPLDFIWEKFFSHILWAGVN